MSEITTSSETSSDCKSYQKCETVTFAEVVGAKTLNSGGMFGDLLKVARVNIEDSKANGELTEEAAGQVYASAVGIAMQQAVQFALTHGKAQKEIAYIASQREYQMLKIDVEKEELDIKRRLTDAQIKQIECQCDNEIKSTDSKISLNAAQESKLACDCCNQSTLIKAQASLYNRQAEGFNDHANQKLYETQLQAWAMVFADTNQDEVNPTIEDSEICNSYHRLASRLEGKWDSNGKYYPAPRRSCS